jgi:nucleotide-binding universal stress UspA family protein
MALALSELQPAPAATVFSRVLVGMAATPGSEAAAAQAALLVEPGGTLELLAAFDPDRRNGNPPPVFLDIEPERERARERLAGAARALPRGAVATTTVVPGRLAAALADEVELGHETCVVIPADAGSAVGELLNAAPCSVLVARPQAGWSPAAIVVGIDGSPESQAAYRAGRGLAERFGGRLVPVAAEGGSGFDAEAARWIVAGRPELSPLGAADALAAASSRADLLIVGSRGLHGAAGIGSVAMRAAREADCSVLVVRAYGD